MCKLAEAFYHCLLYGKLVKLASGHTVRLFYDGYLNFQKQQTANGFTKKEVTANEFTAKDFMADDLTANKITDGGISRAKEFKPNEFAANIHGEWLKSK